MKSKRDEMTAAQIPAHIGIIMDGNGRWAKRKHLPRSAGHRAGVKNINPVIRCALERGVHCVSLYAFSTENKGRPENEVDSLFEIFRKNLKPMTRELIERGVRIMYMGDRTYFPADIQEIMGEVENENTDPSSPTVNIALNYSGRSEIVRAASLAAQKGEITQESLECELYTCVLPPLDMVIRTGGEKRLSNFMLYQAAYSELFFTDTLWPDFAPNELSVLLDEYGHRARRFGKV